MYEIGTSIIMLVVVMVYIAVKLNQISKTLRNQSESLARIAKHLEEKDKRRI